MYCDISIFYVCLCLYVFRSKTEQGDSLRKISFLTNSCCRLDESLCVFCDKISLLFSISDNSLCTVELSAADPVSYLDGERVSAYDINPEALMTLIQNQHHHVKQLTHRFYHFNNEYNLLLCSLLLLPHSLN